MEGAGRRRLGAEGTRLPLASKVAVGPAMSGMLKVATLTDEQHLETFGVVTHVFDWRRPIGGADHASVIDCLDESHFGQRKLTTKKVTGVGPERRELMVLFRRVGTSWTVEDFVRWATGIAESGLEPVQPLAAELIASTSSHGWSTLSTRRW